MEVWRCEHGGARRPLAPCVPTSVAGANWQLNSNYRDKVDLSKARGDVGHTTRHVAQPADHSRGRPATDPVPRLADPLDEMAFRGQCVSASASVRRHVRAEVLCVAVVPCLAFIQPLCGGRNVCFTGDPPQSGWLGFQPLAGAQHEPVQPGRLPLGWRGMLSAYHHTPSAATPARRRRRTGIHGPDQRSRRNAAQRATTRAVEPATSWPATGAARRDEPGEPGVCTGAQQRTERHIGGVVAGHERQRSGFARCQELARRASRFQRRP